ncbi:MAG: hypothetical protein ACUVQG_07325 [Thermogutta sp.]
MTLPSDMNSLIDHWEDLFQPEYQVLVTSKTFAHLCPLVWVEQSPDHKGAPVFREVLFSSVTPEVETEVFRVVQTIPEFEHSRRRILVGHPDWMVLVVPGPQGYPYRLLGGVINTRVLDQDSTIPPLLKKLSSLTGCSRSRGSDLVAPPGSTLSPGKAGGSQNAY